MSATPIYKLACATLLCCVVCLLLAPASGFIAPEVMEGLRANAHSSTQQYNYLGIASPYKTLHLTILLRQQNLDVLDAKFWEISDPESPSYGEFVHYDEIATLIAPPEEVVNGFFAWLENVKQRYQMVEWKLDVDAIHLWTTVEIAESIFAGARFHVYEHVPSKRQLLKQHNPDYQLPAALKPHIDLILGLDELPMATKYHSHRIQSALPQYDKDFPVTPQALRDYYSIDSSKIQFPSFAQGIGAFGDYYSAEALVEFGKQFNTTYNVTDEGYDCFPYCDQFESDLDVQYITSLTPGLSTLFFDQGPEQWIYHWANSLQNRSQPLIWSLSYGFMETAQCFITEYCSNYSVNYVKYIQRTDAELLKLGLQGYTILVSSGDDGAPGETGGENGNCPMDPNSYCPLGGCNVQNTPKCTEITIRNKTDEIGCHFPIGLSSFSCFGYLSNATINDTIDALNIFVMANAKTCDAGLELDAMNNTHFYSMKCSCEDLVTGTSAGLMVSGYTFNQSSGSPFLPDYPTSSPYVTSVGATQFYGKPNTSKPDGEMVCSSQTGAIITGGGGFSLVQPRPHFQKKAVKQYIKLANLNTSLFNESNRAYPDVTFVGHNFLVEASLNANGSCPCQLLPVDGTSASSPSLAGFFSRINVLLQNKGAPPLGPVSPLLYWLSEHKPKTFFDIVTGNNTCTRSYCCQLGYPAVEGWDAASGVGSPRYDKFLKHVVDLKLSKMQLHKSLQGQSFD